MGKKTLIAAIAALISLGAAEVTSAHPHQLKDDEAQERAALQNAKITLSDAITAAEKEVPGGKIIDAEVDFENGVGSYFVEIDKDGVQRVRVDMETGQASKVAVEFDDADHEASTAHYDDEDEDEDDD